MTQKTITKSKQRLSVVISSELADRARNAVYWEPGLTLAALTEQGLQIVLDKLERKRGPYPLKAWKVKLKAGRPVKFKE